MKNLYLIALLFIGVPATSYAQDILDVIGSDGEVAKSYSMKQLDALDQTTYLTKNPFMDGPSKFSGPLARLVLRDAGQEVRDDVQIRMTAINDYKIDVPISDVIEYDVILATRRDGETMSLRNNGPIWIMYPITGHKELDDEAVTSRLVWQLKSIQVVD